jgi:SAM-dependent methyltransferase
MKEYNPPLYWEERLARDFTLGTVGHIGLGKQFNRWVYKSRVATLNKVLKNLSIDLHGKKVLDVGCGTGFWVDYWLKRGAEAVTGMDISETSICRLRERHPLQTFEVSDIQKKWEIKEKYDIISAFAVVNHIVDEIGFDNAISNLGRSLVNGGYLLVSDGFLKKSPVRERHVCWQTLDRYIKVLSAHNIEVVGIFPLAVFMDTPCDMEFTKYVWAARLVRKIWNRVTKRALQSWRLGPIRGVIGPGLFCLDQILLKFLKDGPSMKLLVARSKLVRETGMENERDSKKANKIKDTGGSVVL